jgi:hypothetical protein
MAVATIDYELVDHALLVILTYLSNLESMIVNQKIPTTNHFITEISKFRNEVALEIERQGTRD